jgi:hypothetical protein
MPTNAFLVTNDAEQIQIYAALVVQYAKMPAKPVCSHCCLVFRDVGLDSYDVDSAQLTVASNARLVTLDAFPSSIRSAIRSVSEVRPRSDCLPDTLAISAIGTCVPRRACRDDKLMSSVNLTVPFNTSCAKGEALLEDYPHDSW